MFTFLDAVEIACKAHRGQNDLGGTEYILHPLHVAHKLRHESVETQIAGVLHDAVEDSKLTFEDLEQFGVPGVCIEALKLLTHDKSELNEFLKTQPKYKHDDIKEKEYLEYVERIGENEIARKVKMVDLEHNSCIHRIPSERLKDVKKTGERLVKYAKSMEILKNVK